MAGAVPPSDRNIPYLDLGQPAIPSGEGMDALTQAFDRMSTDYETFVVTLWKNESPSLPMDQRVVLFIKALESAKEHREVVAEIIFYLKTTELFQFLSDSFFYVPEEVDVFAPITDMLIHAYGEELAYKIMGKISSKDYISFFKNRDTLFFYIKELSKRYSL